MKPQPSALRTILGQPSWRLATTGIESYITALGGHLGPATFSGSGKKISPFSVAPWHSEKLDPATPNVLRVLRGDFFCCPFGGNAKPFGKEKHPVHGESANQPWKLETLQNAAAESAIHLSLQTKVRPGRIDKLLWLFRGHPAIYDRHIISGMRGPMDVGHHAMLKFPDEIASGIVTTSPFVHGQVYPGQFEDAATGGYSILQRGAVFDDLQKVPQMDGGIADLSRYPARRGYEDLVMLQADQNLPFAWTAVSFPKQRYVWFALKNPRILRSTIFWLSNGGRHYAPWSSRHVGVLGLEEVTSYFHEGLAESATRNPLNKLGFSTAFKLDAKHPLRVNYIMACLPTPAGFDGVKRIEPDDAGESVTLISKSGKRVKARVDLAFLV